MVRCQMKVGVDVRHRLFLLSKKSITNPNEFLPAPLLKRLMHCNQVDKIGYALRFAADIAERSNRMKELSYIFVFGALAILTEALPMQITINQRQSECMYDTLKEG
jgi:hypothetical protein